jgi:drug/metabolite transporter superfamily protein YnfA
VAAAVPKPSQAAFASDAHRVAARSQRSVSAIAPALVLLAGVVALTAERVPDVMGWGLTAVGGVWLVVSVVKARN